MKKIVFAFGAILAISMLSCIEGDKNESQKGNDDGLIEQSADTALQVTGVAIDGAMNSISLLVGDDTLDFSYPDLDIDHKASWDINDTVTVRYYVTHDGDSVIDVINETDA